MTVLWGKISKLGLNPSNSFEKGSTSVLPFYRKVQYKISSFHLFLILLGD
jgi:hypothetical protein